MRHQRARAVPPGWPNVLRRRPGDNRHLLPVSLPLSISLHLLLFLAHTPAQCAAQPVTLKQRYNIANNFSDWYDHVNALLDYSPTTAVLRGNPRLQRRVLPLFDVLDTLLNATFAEQSVWSEHTCSLQPESAWVKAATNRIKVYQVGELSKDCMTRLDIRAAASTSTSASTSASTPATAAVTAPGVAALRDGFDLTVHRTIVEARAALFDAARQSTLLRELVAQFSPAQWPALHKLSNFNMSIGFQNCHVEYIFAYLVNSTWFVQAETTNGPFQQVYDDRGRHFTNEYIARNWSVLTLPHESLPPNTNPNTNNGNNVNATTTVAPRVVVAAQTILTRWSGSVLPGTVWIDHSRDRETAVAASAARNAIVIERARNDITPSNTAVLALPMAMTLVPVALIADLDVVGMLVYALLTDVFSALPFLIKGVELVRATRDARGTTVALFMGNRSVGQMEVSTARCVATQRFGQAGLGFIAVGLTCMGVGVVLEVGAAMLMHRRRRLRRRDGGCGSNGAADGRGDGCELEEGPFGAAVLKATSRGWFGRLRQKGARDAAEEVAMTVEEGLTRSAAKSAEVW